MLIGLARTSTTDQEAGLNAQLTALKAAGCEKLFVEQVSAIGPRPQREAALDFAREGDTLVVTALSRLARSVADLMAIIKRLEDKGVNLRILDFGGSSIDTKGPTGKLILTLVGAIAEFERSLMLERQLAGIAKAKADGKYKGRVPTAQKQATEIVRRKLDGENANMIAAELKINRSSVFRVLKDSIVTVTVANAKVEEVIERLISEDRFKNPHIITNQKGGFTTIAIIGPREIKESLNKIDWPIYVKPSASTTKVKA
jgi:DNA invertase Pin-like site-specific DNA recombinase